jgi:hypothetical protein
MFPACWYSGRIHFLGPHLVRIIGSLLAPSLAARDSVAYTKRVHLTKLRTALGSQRFHGPAIPTARP